MNTNARNGRNGSVGFQTQTMTPHAQYHATRHFGSLDGLRFICIMGVLWHHAPVWRSLVDAPQLATRGFLGVDFFFVLSGFLITTLLLREERNMGRFSLRGFYWRRALRIIPVYFLVVTAMATYYIVVKGETQYLDVLPYYYLFLSNFLEGGIPGLGPTWSLAVEEQYYMVWPVLLLLTPRKYILPVLAGLIALNVAAVTGSLRVFGIEPVVVGDLVFKMFTATYAPILIGSALAIILDIKNGFGWMHAAFGARQSPVFTFGALILGLAFLPADVAGWPNLVLHLTMAACIASVVVREGHVLKPAFSFAPIVRVGQISYGVYLYHLIALHITTVLLSRFGLQNDWTTFIGYSLLSFVIADISFRYFESRFLAMRYPTPKRVATTK